MKNKIIYLLAILFVMSINGIVSGQNQPIDFETGGFGAGWTWTVFENDTNPPLDIIPNPDASGINTSATVAKFTALQAGNPWAGCESLHGTTDLGPFVLDATNSTIKIMVWKSVISDVGIKLVSANGWSQGEIKVPNTLVNQWEELTFNFAGFLNPPPSEGQLDQIVIFPDFDLAGRTQDNIIYFDNITFSQEVLVGVPTVAAPSPTVPASNVISVFSDVYDNIPGTNLNPNWGQATAVSFLQIQGDTTMKYTNLNYQGIELGSSQNLTAAGMQYLHIDFWNSSSTDLGIFLISPGPVEARVSLVPPGASETWVSVDIPLTDFAPVNLADVFQFKFDGNGTIYFDNIYFSTTISDVIEIPNTFPSDYTLEQNYPNPFNPSTKISFSLPEAGNVTLKVYNLLGQEVATVINQFMSSGRFEVNFDASELPSGIYTYSLSTGNFNSVKKMMLIK
ncbi:MAG: T9SS type A sorting domain-containing protein [Ignavibacterium sp.]|nr:T9SS type A sorting domain-containing protein [Ignavibacterium sp.]